MKKIVAAFAMLGALLTFLVLLFSVMTRDQYEIITTKNIDAYGIPYTCTYKVNKRTGHTQVIDGGYKCYQ